MTKQLWLDTSMEDQFAGEYDYFTEKLNNFVTRFEKRYGTMVYGFLLIGERHGRICYRFAERVEDLVFCDSTVQIYVDDDKLIHVDYFDHDGTTYSTIKLISETAWNDVDDYTGGSIEELDLVEYYKKKGQLKPTKFWQAK